MQGLQNRKNKYSLLGAILITSVCYVVFCFTGLIYEYTDNITVAAVVDGMYGDNNFCQYLHPFLCVIIRCLTPLFPTADVFTSLIHLALLCSTGLLSYIALQSLKSFKDWQLEDYIRCALLILTIVYPTLGMKLFGVNYTVQTAAIIFAGVIVLFYAKEQRESRIWTVLGTILVSFGFLVRQEAALLFIPFVALELVIEFFRSEDRKAYLHSSLKTILPCIVIVFVLLASRAVFYSREPYSTDDRYNRNRTIAEDYWMKGYDRYDPAFESLDESTYSAARDWILADTDRLDADMLEKVAAAGNVNKYVSTIEGATSALKAMYRRITQEDLHLLILTVLAIVLTLWNFIASKSILLKIETVLAFLGGFIILFYFTFIGRAPMRVWQCVLFAMLAVLILVMIKDEHGSKQTRITGTIFQLLLCVILYFGVGQVMAVSEFHEFQTPLTAMVGADDSAYEKTFSDDALYIWPVWHSTIPDFFSEQNKLPTQRVIDHNIAIGDWVYGQQYFRDFLKRVDAENPALALLERPNTYLMEGQNKQFITYMREHYGEDIELEEAGEVNKKKVYKLVRRNDISENPAEQPEIDDGE